MKFAYLITVLVVVGAFPFCVETFLCMPSDKVTCEEVNCGEEEETVMGICGCCKICQKKVLGEGDECRGIWLSRIDDCENGLVCTANENPHMWTCQKETTV